MMRGGRKKRKETCHLLRGWAELESTSDGLKQLLLIGKRLPGMYASLFLWISLWSSTYILHVAVDGIALLSSPWCLLNERGEWFLFQRNSTASITNKGDAGTLYTNTESTYLVQQYTPIYVPYQVHHTYHRWVYPPSNRPRKEISRPHLPDCVIHSEKEAHRDESLHQHQRAETKREA